MKRLLIIALSLLLAVSVVACGPASIMSGEDRDLSPDVSENQLAELLQGNGEFALSLYNVLKDEKDGNLFYSPYSISLMMTMAYAGARGET